MGVLLLLFGCGGGKDSLRNGDLVFVGISAEHAALLGNAFWEARNGGAAGLAGNQSAADVTASWLD